MKFVNPYILFALFAVIIPIIIHLFNFKRFKKIFFSNVQFLIAYKQETQKQSKLKHLLILIARILTLIFLVFAFAQPYIPQKDKKISTNGNLISIYIDNSFSMEALSVQGTLLDQAKNKAKEIVNAYNPSDLFQLITNNFEGKHQSFYSKEEFLLLLNEVNVSSYSRKVSAIIKRQKDAFGTVNSKNKISFLISDFQKSITDIDNLKNDTATNVYFLPLISQKNENVYIDSCWFQAPTFYKNSQLSLNVLVKNNSTKNLEKIPLKLFLNDKQRALAAIDLPANSEKVVTLNYKTTETGIHVGYVEVLDNPVVFDDRFYLSYNVSDQIRICCINEMAESSYLNALFAKDSAVFYSNISVNKLDYSKFKTFQFIILNELKTISSGLSQELKDFVENGGSVLVFPSSDADLASYKSFSLNMNTVFYEQKDTANTKVTLLNLDHELFANVFEKVPENMDLPIVSTHYKIQSGSFSTEEFIMKMQNEELFLVSQKIGKGKVYLCAVALTNDESNFPKHALFIPSIYNMALYSKPVFKLYYTIGRNEAVEINNIDLNRDQILKMVNSELKVEIIPEHKSVDFNMVLFPHDQIQKSENYFLWNGDNRILAIAFNYDRVESVMQFYSINDLQEKLEKAGLLNFKTLDINNKTTEKVINTLNKGLMLWKWCIVLALLFIFIEVLLLRFLKK